MTVTDVASCIMDEYDHLLDLNNAALTRVVGHSIPNRHLGKEDSIITYLLTKFSYEDVVAALYREGLSRTSTFIIWLRQQSRSLPDGRPRS